MTEEQEEKSLFNTAVEQRTELGLKGTLDSFMAGARWQAKRSYSEEEVMILLNRLTTDIDNLNREAGHTVWVLPKPIYWFEKFKKK